ncbi:hypothetical protein [Chryseobacterium sp. FH1]|uniref:hypothetical protein n=1 Tax=Chryseobacterium sp. FH1 TaxID=1233951 RepID=UPI0004E3EA00|nr:hypothetical protein [Chryseobacterium sp. FH1]KFC20465.1 hypothetical protein IO90_15030 [Chryseobacterium sp. FH1]
MKKVFVSILITFSFNAFSQKKGTIDTINCKYRENKVSICPICKTDKKVLSIFYGLTTTKFMKENKNKYYFEGCEITGCDPNWYCKTDDYKF